MSLPTSRNTTYAPGSQVKSADLNDLQDQIIAANTIIPLDGRDMQIVIPSAAFCPDPDHGFDIGYENSGNALTFGHLKATGAGANAVAPLILPVGARLKTVVVSWFHTNSTAQVRTVTLGRTQTSNDTVHELGQATDSVTTGVRSATFSGLNHTILNTDDYWIAFHNLQVDDYIKSALVTYDFP